MKCDGTAAAALRVAATVDHYPVIDSPVVCTPPTCMPPPPPPPPKPPPPPPKPRTCPPKAGEVPYMAACKAGDKGQQWAVSAAGVISSVAAPALALGTARPGSVELVAVAAAQPFLFAPNQNLYFNGTAAGGTSQRR